VAGKGLGEDAASCLPAS